MQPNTPDTYTQVLNYLLPKGIKLHNMFPFRVKVCGAIDSEAQCMWPYSLVGHMYNDMICTLGYVDLHCSFIDQDRRINAPRWPWQPQSPRLASCSLTHLSFVLRFADLAPLTGISISAGWTSTTSMMLFSLMAVLLLRTSWGVLVSLTAPWVSSAGTHTKHRTFTTTLGTTLSWPTPQTYVALYHHHHHHQEYQLF